MYPGNQKLDLHTQHDVRVLSEFQSTVKQCVVSFLIFTGSASVNPLFKFKSLIQVVDSVQFCIFLRYTDLRNLFLFPFFLHFSVIFVCVRVGYEFLQRLR